MFVTNSRLANLLVLALMLLAIVAPSAEADDWWATTTEVDASSVRPDDRSATRGPGTALASAGLAGIEQQGSFDWVAAGIGFATASGIVLLAGGLVVARRHRTSGLASL